MDNLSQTPTEPHDYATVDVVWAALLTAPLRRHRRATAMSRAPTPSELPVYGLATFALTKALTKEKVGVWAREPLVDGDGAAGQARPPARAAAGCATCSASS